VKRGIKMAKRTNSFSCKGELSLAEGVVFEVKKESVDTIPFFDILKEFDGKTVKISIVEDIEIVGEEAEVDEDEE
jgi:predicted RNA-binding protein